MGADSHRAGSVIDRIRTAVRARPLIARVAGNVSWLLLERLVVLVTGFAVNIAFVRYAGPERYGVYSYALSFAALFTSLSALGMDGIVIRELTRHPGAAGPILGTATWVRIAASVIAWGAAIVAIRSFRRDETTQLLVVVLAAGGVCSAASAFELWFQARLSARGPVLARTSANVLSQATRGVLIASGAPLSAFAAAQVAAQALSAAMIAWLYARVNRLADAVFEWPRARALLKDSWPQAIASISIIIYMKVDQVMLGAIAGDHETGIYAVAATLSELWYFVPLAIGSAAFPVIVSARDTLTSDSFNDRMQLFYDAMAALGYAVAIPVMVLAGPIVGVLYGSQYAESATVLRIHVVSFIFVCIGLARGRYLVAENLMKFSMLATLAGACANVGLNVYLIPRYGAVGAAWATLASYALANYASGFVDPNVRGQTWLLTRALAVPLRSAQLWRPLLRG